MQTIEISTTQNVTIEYELAGLRERFFGMLIDAIIMIFIYIALAIILSMTTFSEGSENRFIQTVIGFFPIWFTPLYAITCEVFLNGQTIGKRTQHTKVVRIDGKPISLSDLLLRGVLLLSDFLFSGGVLGALLISTTDKKQRLGDMAAGTTVIKIGTDRRFRLLDILNINTLDNYTPQYPQVKQLSEDDMLFIKNVILRYQKYRNGSHEEAIDALYNQLKKALDIKSNLTYTNDKIDFFKGLIKDYIVLTR
jgi:uncharacterized RDD family membrane protein YckC